MVPGGPLRQVARPACSGWTRRPSPTDSLYLVSHRALRDVPRVRVVWELLLERLAQSPTQT